MIKQNEITIGPAPTMAEVAEQLGMHPSTLYRMAYRGELKVLSGFGRLRVCPKSLEKLLSKSHHHTPSPAAGRGRKAAVQVEAAEVRHA
jgi:hypothetical protein